MKIKIEGKQGDSEIYEVNFIDNCWAAFEFRTDFHHRH